MRMRLTFSACLTALLLCFSALLPGSAQACSVPVFRYALERWPADYYVAVVFNHGPLNKEQKKIVNLLSEDGLAGKVHANIYAVTVDVDKKVPEQLVKIWEKQKKQAKTFPWLVLLYPWQTGIPAPAWTGPLDEKTVKSIIDSPARQELAKRLLGGDSAVWLLLECGKKKKDEAAYQLLKKQLDKLQKEIQPPEIDAEDVAMGYFSGDPSSLKIKFSILRVSRKAPAEKMLVEMLLGSEPDLRTYKDEPMVFPIFGRARALFALVGKGINPDTITESAFILTGPCTCTIKGQNPGTDLVVAVDWEGKLEEQYEKAMSKLEQQAAPNLAGLGALTSGTPTTSNTDAAHYLEQEVESVASVAPQSNKSLSVQTQTTKPGNSNNTQKTNRSTVSKTLQDSAKKEVPSSKSGKDRSQTAPADVQGSQKNPPTEQAQPLPKPQSKPTGSKNTLPHAVGPNNNLSKGAGNAGQKTSELTTTAAGQNDLLTAAVKPLNTTTIQERRGADVLAPEENSQHRVLRNLLIGAAVVLVCVVVGSVWVLRKETDKV